MKTETKTRNEVLTPSHQMWRGFIARLNDGLLRYGCNHETYDIIEKILASLPNISISDTMDYFEKKGVFCNCEVFHKTDWRKKITPAEIEIDRGECKIKLKKSGY